MLIFFIRYRFGHGQKLGSALHHQITIGEEPEIKVDTCRVRPCRWIVEHC